MSVFDRLSGPLRVMLAHMGMEVPTEPQELAIPVIMEGANLLLVAPTGMGKTEAAVLPVFDRIVKERPKAPSFIYITPLRALNRDLLKRLKDWGGKLGIKVGVRHGDTTQKERIEQVKKPPDMLITTPETLQIMFGGVMLRELLTSVKWLVVDEVHELAGDERGWQMSVALERLATVAGDFQRIGLSATVGNPDEVGRFLAGVGRSIKVLKVPVGKSLKINVERPKPDEKESAEADRMRIDGETFAALKRCRELIKKHRSTLLFVNTRDNAEVLASRFSVWDPGFPVGVHHGSLYRDVRIQMEDDFKSEKLKGLICTSSLELGIDVGSVDLALQYGSPRQATRLVQRAGRSGHRRGLTSEATILTRDADDVAESAVLSRMAMAEEIEPVEIRNDPLCVLANQLVAFTIGNRDLVMDNVYATIRKAYPFRDLSRPVFDSVLGQLSSLRLLWVKGKTYTRSRGAIPFFFGNLSMIPDEKTYRIIDITTRKSIGTLDEFFISNYGEVGVRFIVKGASWRIIEVKDDTVLVEPSGELGAIPGWIGEEIPVPYEAAQEVGRLRIGSLDGSVKAGTSIDNYPVDVESRNVFRAALSAQTKGNHPMPTNDRVTVELSNRLLIVNACFGTKVNETLARLLSAFISARLSSEIGIQTDPYRIMLELPAPVNPETIIEHLKKMAPDDVGKVLELVLPDSSLFRRELLHTARKFGAIEKDADFQKVNFERVARLFRDTPLFDEALQKTLFNRMDIPRTMDVIRRISEGAIELVVSKPSPIGTVGVQQRWETLAAGKVERPILLAFKARLQRSPVRILCIACKKTRRHVISEMPAKLLCSYCGGKMVASVPLWDEKSIDAATKRSRSAEDGKTAARLKKNANLVLAHGKKAVLALAARGVGVDTAARILQFQHETEEEFLRALLAAEVQYAKTRRFW